MTSVGTPPSTGNAAPTHYEVLGVAVSCTFEELRSAYRKRARELHPDVSHLGDNGTAMARVNAAWQILSDPDTRERYDAALRSTSATPRTPRRPDTPHGAGRETAGTARSGAVEERQPAPRSGRARRQAWVRGLQAQILRLSRLAGRSATQAMLVRSNRAPRETYDRLVEQIVASLTEDTEARVRSARAAGAAPLDLGVAATLVGLRALADQQRRRAALGVSAEELMTAELIDRMWDILAHELTKQLTVALGGNPHLRQVLGRR